MVERCVLILGGDLLDEVTLGPMTENRVRKGIALARDMKAHLYVAAGFYPEYKDGTYSMGALMARAITSAGLEVSLIGPDTDFNTRGELRVFMSAVPTDVQKVVVSASWHLPRVRKIIAKEWGKEIARSFDYVGSDDPFTIRLAVLEALKSGLLFMPESMRSLTVSTYRRLFGRSSW